MRILCIHPQDSYNIGDLMTYYGAVSLMRQSFPGVEMLQFDIRRAEQEIDTYVPEYNWGEDVDVILLAGSPWIGMDEHSLKLRIINQAIDRWENAYKVALGIGSFFSHRQITENDMYNVCVEFLRDFDLIVTRDVYASKVLNTHDIKNFLSYDTSIYYCVETTPSSNQSILVYYDPFCNNVVDHLDATIWQKYLDFQLSWADSSNAEIIVITSGDKASLDDRNINGRFVTDLTWLANRLSKAKQVLSGRVHMAILARLAGCKKVLLLPVDSRYAAAVNVGIDICQPVKDLFPIVRLMPFELRHIKRYLKTVVKLIQNVVLGN